MSRGLNTLSIKVLSSLKQQLYKGKSITTKSSLKNVPPTITLPPYALNGTVPPSPSQAEIKTNTEIEYMRDACKVGRKILNAARDFVKVNFNCPVTWNEQITYCSSLQVSV